MSSSNPLTPEQEANDLVLDMCEHIQDTLAPKFILMARSMGVSEENVMRILAEGFASLSAGYLYAINKTHPEFSKEVREKCTELVSVMYSQMTFGAPFKEIN